MKPVINKLAKQVERLIIYALIIMMAGILVLATIELGYYLVINILESNYLLINLDRLMDLFGIFLLVLIGIELLDTIKVYLKESVVHVEVVVLVAIIALARKVVVLKIEELSGELTIGIGVLIIALALAYYLIKRAGLMICNLKSDDEIDADELEEKITNKLNKR
ncbi:MAG TPA: phosphate-starvation-inducible PsiE family protein [Prolixibacteraceae bacterium]|nr:phosphate-starvation-inducible PsiE family protein [Prolixibacteraceae bacterium]